jgi:hypothetical protein
MTSRQNKAKAKCKEADGSYTALLGTAYPPLWLPLPLYSESGRPSSRKRRRRRRTNGTCLEAWNNFVVLVAEIQNQVQK